MSAEWGLAACLGLDTELFFPEAGAYKNHIAAVKAVCALCPQRQRCLEVAITEGITEGVWGGLAAHERAPIAREYRAAVRAARRERKAAQAWS